MLEGQTGKARKMVFPVTLSQLASSTVHVAYTIQPNGSATAPDDFKAVTKTLTLKPNKKTGLTNTTANIVASVNADTNTESDETFAVTLTSVDDGYEIDDGAGVGTILTDDADPSPSVGIGDVTVYEGNTGTYNTVKVPVTLSDPASGTQTVQVSVTGGTATSGADFKAIKPKTLKFKSGHYEQFVAVSVIPDATPESNETIQISITGASPGLTVTRGVATVTIVNDD